MLGKDFLHHGGPGSWTMTTCCIGVLVCWQAMFAGMSAQTPVTSAPADLAGVNPAWVAPTQKNIDQQSEMLIAAFELDEAQAKAVTDELHRRMVAQVPIERQYQADKIKFIKDAKKRTGSRSGASPEERRAFMIEMKHRLEAMPLYEKRVADWVEQQLPPERAAAGRIRLEELWRLRDMRREAFFEDGQRRGAAKATMLSEKRKEIARVGQQGEPIPSGPKRTDSTATAEQQVDVGRFVQLNRGISQTPQIPKPLPKVSPFEPRFEPQAAEPSQTSQPSETASERDEDKPAAATQPPPPAPPLSAWDKYVINAAQKYSFTDAHVAKAREILANLQKRAEQYRQSRAGDYARARLLADPKDRAERMKQLDAAVDALDAELKARLDSLLTPEQRQKAAAPPPRQ
jgi:hypothetical protein